MQIIISRLAELHEGFDISVKFGDKVQNIALLNGNKATHNGPVVMLSIDQHILYGMSHPTVISRILKNGPQHLIASRDLSHKLFEHGMKSSLGEIKIQNNIFRTNMGTFYTVIGNVGPISLIQEGKQFACSIDTSKWERPSKRVVISQGGFFVPASVLPYEHIVVDNIKTTVAVKI